MRRFKFKLERLLRVKERIEKERIKEVAQQRSKIGSIKEWIAEMGKELDGMLEKRDRICHGPLILEELKLVSLMIDYQRRKREEALSRLAREEKALEVMVAALTEASREAEMVRKLKESEQKRYLEELRKSEQKERDENGIIVKGIRNSQRS